MSKLLPVAKDENNWLDCTVDQFSLRLYIQHSAKKTIVSGEYCGALKIRLAAPPVDGKANKALLLWLSKLFSVQLRAVSLVSGEKNRRKHIIIEGTFSEREVLNRLGIMQ